MKDLQYGDLYKFLVSVGMLLLAGAVVVPWLFLKEPFDLLLPSAQIATLTTVAQSVVERRQTMAQVAMMLVPWVSGVSGVVGLTLVLTGLLRWKTQQAVKDTTEALQLEKLKREIEELSPSEIEAKIESEGDEAFAPVLEGVPQVAAGEPARTYERVERAVVDLCSTCLVSDYTVLSNKRIGAAVYDLILRSRRDGAADRIVEIKYVARGFGINWLRDNISRVLLSTQVYADHLGRPATGTLLVVGPKKLINEKKRRDYESQLIQSPRSEHGDVNVVFLADEDIAGLSCAAVRQMVVDGTGAEVQG